MKSVLYAAAALLLAATAAHAGPVSDRAGPKAPETGDRAAVTTTDRMSEDRNSGDRMPVALERDVDFGPALSGPERSGSSTRGWTGNDNEG